MRQASPRPAAKWLLYIAFVFFVAASLLAIHRGRNYDPHGSQTCDFIAPYSGARCLLRGCNPYDAADLQSQYVAAHGNLAALDARHNWTVLLPVYPPSTFLLISPLTALNYSHAQFVWFYSSTILFCISLGLLSQLVATHYRWLFFLLAGITLSSANTDFLFGPGNPSTFAIAFAALAVWAFFARPFSTESRSAKSEWLGIAALALSLAMKPHMAIAVFLFLLLRRSYRRPAILAGVIALLLLAVSVGRLQSTTGSEWRHKFQAAVTGGIQPGGTNEPGPANPSAPHILNLQAAVSVFTPQPARYTRITLALVALAGIWWLAALLRATLSRAPLQATEPSPAEPSPAEPRPAELLTALAGLLCLSFLPLYHRDYDCRLLILTLPPLVTLLAHRRLIGWALLISSTPLLFSQTTMHAIRYLQITHQANLSPLATALYLRQQPIALFLLALLWPAALWFSRIPDASSPRTPLAPQAVVSAPVV